MKQLIIKSLIFIALISFILLKIDPFFIDNSTWKAGSFNSFYEEEKNTSDIIFIGTSQLNDGIDTYIIDAKCNTNSVKICGPGMNMAQTYFNLKEALNRQSPKIVAIETYSLITPVDVFNNSIDDNGNMALKSYKTEYYKRFGKAKQEEICLIYPEDKVYHMFNFFRFHEGWTDDKQLSKSIMTKLSSDPKRFNQNLSRGAKTFINQTQIHKFENKNFDSDKYLISDDEKLYLNKIIELSRLYNFELLFFKVPVLDVYYNNIAKRFNESTDELKTFLNKYDNIKHYDINGEVGGYDRTHFKPDVVSNNQHLNYKGMIKTSSMLAKFINSNYTLNKQQVREAKTLEDILYSNEKIEKDSVFFGDVSGINHLKYSDGDNVTNTIVLPQDQTNIAIWGWMFKSGLNLKKSFRKIALKKNNNFIFVSNGNLKRVKNSYVPNRFKQEFEQSGYSIYFNKKLLEKGKYKIYHILESNKGEMHIMDMQKWVIIE